MSLTTRLALKAMEKIAPLRLAEKWDNVGLLLESPVPRQNANRILLTIDLTPSVLTEALAHPSTSLIIAYHPPIFKPLSALTLSAPLPGALLKLAAAGVSVYSPHTALDSVWGGINDWLARGVGGGGGGQSLGGDDTTSVSILGETKGDEGGVGRLVVLPRAIPIEELAERIKAHLGIPYVDVAKPMTQNPVRTVAICAGSGGSVVGGVDADVYFTGEMSHHEVLAAVAAGRYVVLCGHTNTERGYLPILASTLRSTLAEFAKQGACTTPSTFCFYFRSFFFFFFFAERDEDVDVDVVVSQTDKHPLQRM
ncbi:NGG1p interacting factor 3 [Phlebopus sp. FC_14]|nr:NGG1p interacting factor 3 [Phlebopus sp. FC_14]